MNPLQLSLAFFPIDIWIVYLWWFCGYCEITYQSERKRESRGSCESWKRWLWFCRLLYLLRQRREIDCVVWCFLPHPHHSQQGNGELFGPINFQVAVVWNGFRTIIPAGKGLDAWTCCGGRDKPILVRYHQPSNLTWVRFSLVGEGSIMVGHKWRIIRFQFPVAFIL